MDFDPAEIAYVPTIGARRVHATPLVAAKRHLIPAPQQRRFRGAQP